MRLDDIELILEGFSWEAELPEYSSLSWSLLEPFPRGLPSGCRMCPPKRTQGFQRRALWRGLVWDYRRGTEVRQSFASRRDLYCVMFVGMGLEALSEMLEKKETILKTFLSTVVVLALVVFPAVLLGINPQGFGVIPQVLFSLLLFAASAWFGYSFNSAAAEKAVSSRWLPAAEGACKQLITISYISERIQNERGQNCNQVQTLLGQLPEDQRLPISTLADTQCRSCADKIATLKSQVDTSIADWEVFIGTNCTGDECLAINERLDTFRHQQAQTLLQPTGNGK